MEPLNESEFEDIPMEEQTLPIVSAPEPRPHPMELIEEASKTSPLEWEAKYKRASAEAYRDGIVLLNEKETDPSLWTLWDHEHDSENPVQIFKRIPTNSFPCIFRAHAVVNGRAERYIWAIKDHDRDTRLVWDRDSVESVQQLETYRPPEGDIDVVKCVVKSPHWAMSPRLLLGVQTTSYNAKDRTHIYAYQTSEHFYFSKHYKETVHRNCVLVDKCMVFIWISPLKNNQCALKMIVCIDPGNLWAAGPALHATYPAKLRERIRLWERVVRDWKIYYPLDPKLVENRK